VFFKASGSRFGGLAKARFAGRILARESPDFFASVTNGAARKWQTARELLERGRQQFGVLAVGAIPVRRGLCISADPFFRHAIMDWLILSSASTKYRPDIDGLRAIAVMLVVIFHAFPEAVPGGFVGVDIFFVISGFLITGIIVRELDQKRFSLLAFYNRRIRRIFPALIVVLCVTMVLGWLWMLPAAYAQLSSDVFASAAFFANIALLRSPAISTSNPPGSRCCIFGHWASKSNFICSGR
jgi:Acyltransferase family